MKSLTIWFSIFIVLMVGRFSPCFSQNEGIVGPSIEVYPSQLNFNTPQFLWSVHPLTIKNNGDQPLNFQITDESLSGRSNRAGLWAAAPLKMSRMINRLQHLRREIASGHISVRPPAIPQTGRGTLQSVITDPAGDVQYSGADIVQIGFEETFFTYNITLQFAGTPDTAMLALVSFDTDQNFGTGGYPPPFGYGLGNADIGSEYEIFFDFANLFGDTLGLPPSAFILDARDSIPSLVGLPGLLTISGNQATASFLKAGLNVFDSDMNLSALCVSLSQATLPDFAPDFGHGTFGNELGSSWICALDTNGVSGYPFTGQVAPGDSTRVLIKVAAAFPNGVYMGKLKIQNNSATPLVEVPVQLTVGQAGQPQIQVWPPTISDTLSVGGPRVEYQLQITNSGTAPLGYVLADTVWNGDGWLEMPFPIGWVEPGAQSLVTIGVNPAGFQPNQTYTGRITVYSTDTLHSPIEVPVEIYAAAATGIGPVGEQPDGFLLEQNYPNPFNPATRFAINLPRAGTVEINIYTADGKLVRRLYKGILAAGRHTFEWNGSDNAGNTMASGLYIYRVKTGDWTAVKKMLLLK